MTQKFGSHALAQDEFQMTTQERIAAGLADTPQAGALSLPKINALGKARLRTALSELAAGNVDNVNLWLQQVAAQSPAKAIELFIQLAEFGAARLKAVATVSANFNEGDAPLRNASVHDLMRIVSEQTGE